MRYTEKQMGEMICPMMSARCTEVIRTETLSSGAKVSQRPMFIRCQTVNCPAFEWEYYKAVVSFYQPQRNPCELKSSRERLKDILAKGYKVVSVVLTLKNPLEPFHKTDNHITEVKIFLELPPELRKCFCNKCELPDYD